MRNKRKFKLNANQKFYLGVAVGMALWIIIRGMPFNITLAIPIAILPAIAGLLALRKNHKIGTAILVSGILFNVIWYFL